MGFRVPEQFRVTGGEMGTTADDGNNGLFVVTLRFNQRVIVIASDGGGWDHVSVSRKDRCPTWEEMAQVRDLFWSPDDCVMQLHPPHNKYVNNHPYCLHLWRPQHTPIPQPDPIMVGIR